MQTTYPLHDMQWQQLLQQPACDALRFCDGPSICKGWPLNSVHSALHTYAQPAYREILLHHASSAHIRSRPLEPAGGDDYPLGVIPHLQGPLACCAGSVQPCVCVLLLALLALLLLEGVA